MTAIGNNPENPRFLFTIESLMLGPMFNEFLNFLSRIVPVEYDESRAQLALYHADSSLYRIPPDLASLGERTLIWSNHWTIYPSLNAAITRSLLVIF